MSAETEGTGDMLAGDLVSPVDWFGEDRPDGPNAADDEPLTDAAAEPSQLMLLDMEEPWRTAWRGMPEFVQEDLTPAKSVLVHFETDTDMEDFAKLLKQTVTPNTRSLWYPEAEIGRLVDKRYADDPDA